MPLLLGLDSIIKNLPPTAFFSWANALVIDKEKNNKQLVADKKVFLDMIFVLKVSEYG